MVLAEDMSDPSITDLRRREESLSKRYESC